MASVLFSLTQWGLLVLVHSATPNSQPRRSAGCQQWRGGGGTLHRPLTINRILPLFQATKAHRQTQAQDHTIACEGGDGHLVQSRKSVSRWRDGGWAGPPLPKDHQRPPRTTVASNPTTLSRPIGRHAPTEDTWEKSRPIIIVIITTALIILVTIIICEIIIKANWARHVPPKDTWAAGKTCFPILAQTHLSDFVSWPEQEAFSRICLQSKPWHHSGLVSLCVLSALLTLKVVVSSSKFFSFLFRVVNRIQDSKSSGNCCNLVHQLLILFRNLKFCCFLFSLL